MGYDSEAGSHGCIGQASADPYPIIDTDRRHVLAVMPVNPLPDRGYSLSVEFDSGLQTVARA
jgi:hypothetical protein